METLANRVAVLTGKVRLKVELVSASCESRPSFALHKLGVYL